MSIWIAAAVAFAITTVLTPVFREVALRRDTLDIPNERSSHSQPTPRNGGYAIFVGIATVFALSRAFSDRTVIVVAICMVLLISLAMADEAAHIDQRVRLVLQLVIASIAAIAGHLTIHTVSAGVNVDVVAVSLALSMFWLVGVINGYNFMDGLNGIAAIEAIVCGAAQSVLLLRMGDVVVTSIVAAAAASSAGFLIYNSRGTVFMGDTGSTTLGFIFAAAAIRLSQERVSFIAAALPLAPFLFDTSVTLVRRIVRGEPFLRAHRSHFYQQLNQQGWSHMSVSIAWGCLAAASGIVALQYDAMTAVQKVVALAFVGALHAIVFTAIAVRSRSRARA